MPREITVRDTHSDETFSAVLLEGGSNKFTHRGDMFARVSEVGGDREGWVELTEVAA
jgi:hypothetical protein